MGFAESTARRQRPEGPGCPFPYPPQEGKSLFQVLCVQKSCLLAVDSSLEVECCSPALNEYTELWPGWVETPEIVKSLSPHPWDSSLQVPGDKMRGGTVITCPVTGGKMPALKPRATGTPVDRVLPTGPEAEQVNLGAPWCCLWWEIQAWWNPLHQPLSLGAVTFIPLWSKGTKGQNSQREDPALPLLAVMQTGSKRCLYKARRGSQEQGKNCSPVLRPPTPHRERTSDVMAAPQPFLRRDFSKLTHGWQGLGVGGCHSGIISTQSKLTP